MSDHPRFSQVLRAMRSSRLEPLCFKRLWDAGCCAVCVGRLCGVSAGLSYVACSTVPQEVWEAALNRFLAGKQGTDGTGSASAASTNSVVATSTDAPSGHTSDAAAPAAGAAPAEAPGLVPHPACSVCTVCCGLLQDSATVMTGDPPPLRFPRAAPPPVRADKRQRLGADPEDGIQEGGAGAGAGTSLQAVVEDAVVPVEDDAPPTGGGAGAGDVNPAGLPAAPVDTHFEGVDLRTLALPRSTVAIVAFIRDKGYEGIVDYTLAVQMPQYMQLREYLMRCAIGEVMGMTMANLDKSFPTVELRRFLRCGLSESLTPVLGGVPYADSAEDADVAMTIACIHPDADFNLREFLLETTPRAQHHRSKQLPSMERILAPYASTVGYPDAVSAKFRALAPLTAPASYMVSVLRRPVYLSGRYLKIARGLSQTKWLIGGVQKGLGSVEELIGPVAAKHFKCTQTVFHSAGREDSDVRMLGSGRPFVVELVNSFVRPDDLEATAEVIQREVNEGTDLIEINSLAPTTKEHFVALQNGADSKRKKYICVVWVSKALTPADLAMLNGLKDIVVKQDTPIRVAHRRSMMTRTKYIHEVCAAPINAHFMHLTLTTSAGTYVKEFVHGDLGRTTPSVGSLLGCDADILQLDVLDLVYTGTEGDAADVESDGEDC